MMYSVDITIFEIGNAHPSTHKFHFTIFIPTSFPLLYKMKTSSKTATTASTSTIANALSKSAAVTFFVTSLFGVVYSNSYVSLFQKVKHISKLHQFLNQLP